MKILETQHITKTFDGVHAVENLSVAFESGKITSIIGPNGSGKTTLTNLLTGVYGFDKGVVAVEGVSLKKIPAHTTLSYGITRTFQEVRLIEQISVLDNILLVLTPRNIFSALFDSNIKLQHEQAEVALKKVNLWEKRNEEAGNLSYGQRKLLEIARVLALISSTSSPQPNIIIFDEPFAGLFKEIIKIIVDILKELRQQGKTIILIEHNMDLIRELSDHLIVMDSGKLLAEGPPSEVLARRDVIEAYLGE